MQGTYAFGSSRASLSTLGHVVDTSTEDSMLWGHHPSKLLVQLTTLVPSPPSNVSTANVQTIETLYVQTASTEHSFMP